MRADSQRLGLTYLVTIAGVTAFLLTLFAGCDPTRDADCIPRGTIFGGGDVLLTIAMNEQDVLVFESNGIEEALLGDGQVGEFGYDDTTMGESSAYLWSFPEHSTVEAHFEWPALDPPGDGACASAADKLVLQIGFPNEPPQEGDFYEIVSQVLSTTDELLVESRSDLSEEEGSHESTQHGVIEATNQHFPHLVDCLGGPSVVDQAKLLTIMWDFDSETSVNLCRPVARD